MIYTYEIMVDFCFKAIFHFEKSSTCSLVQGVVSEAFESSKLVMVLKKDWKVISLNWGLTTVLCSLNGLAHSELNNLTRL